MAVSHQVEVPGSENAPGHVASAPNESVHDDAAAQLERRILNFLLQRGVQSTPRLSITVENGTVTLCGTVNSFHERQLCLSCCQHVAGVLRLVDELKVHLQPST